MEKSSESDQMREYTKRAKEKIQSRYQPRNYEIELTVGTQTIRAHKMGRISSTHGKVQFMEFKFFNNNNTVTTTLINKTEIISIKRTEPCV